MLKVMDKDDVVIFNFERKNYKILGNYTIEMKNGTLVIKLLDQTLDDLRGQND